MAIVAPNIQVVKRSEGRSSVAFAAYRAAALLHDERTGETHDYTRKGGVVHTEIMAPDYAPDWVYDRQQLWSAVETINNRKDSQVAREFMLPLPHELSAEQRLQLVRDFVREELVKHGMIADVAIHLPERNGDQRNHHAHITCTMRTITPDGFDKQNRDWNDDFAARKKVWALRKAGKTEEADQFEEQTRKTRPIFLWRENWAKHINRALKAAKIDEQVDHRSWAEQGVDRVAEPHMGPDATAMERRGEETDLGNERKEIQERNAEREQEKVIELAAERRKRDAAKAEHMAARALQETRTTIAALEQFDQAHADINFYSREITKALSQIRRYEGRQNYARTLAKTVDKNFKEIFGKDADRARQRYQADIDTLGIHKANRLLLEHPRRFGSLPGWQVGKRLFFSKKRYIANGLLLATADISRQSFYMQRKIDGEHDIRALLQTRIAQLKTDQQRIFDAPPEGRVLIQRLIQIGAEHLSDPDWKKLSKKEKFHLMQARTLMRHHDLQKWADKKIEEYGPDPAASPALRRDPNALHAPVDLEKVSAQYTRAALGKKYHELRQRQAEEKLATTAATQATRDAIQAEEDAIQERRRGMATSFTQLLATATGLQPVLARIRAWQDERRHAAQKEREITQNMQRAEQLARHAAEKKAVGKEYDKLAARERLLRARDENALDITQDKRRGRKSDDDTKKPNRKRRRRGRGYRYKPKR